MLVAARHPGLSVLALAYRGQGPGTADSRGDLWGTPRVLDRPGRQRHGAVRSRGEPAPGNVLLGPDGAQPTLMSAASPVGRRPNLAPSRSAQSEMAALGDECNSISLYRARIFSRGIEAGQKHRGCLGYVAGSRTGSPCREQSALLSSPSRPERNTMASPRGLAERALWPAGRYCSVTDGSRHGPVRNDKNALIRNGRWCLDKP